MAPQIELAITYIDLEKGQKIYFASDVHLGLPNYEISLRREKHFVNWLNMVRQDAAAIYLVGDIFDFWWEYKKVAPRGFTRFLGTIANITDSGIPVHLFTGNHDIWIKDYLPQETGVILHTEEFIFEENNKRFFVAHGDGLGPGDHKFKLLKRIFTNKFLQWGFSRLHPNFALWLGHSWSVNSRYTQGKIPPFFGVDKEWLILFAKEKLQKEHFDYFIFGHRHLALDIMLNKNSKFLNLGDWISNFTYAIFDGNDLKLKKFLPPTELNLNPDGLE
ncbi:MAG: UDP-2,3-diacylglucosamine diphosphatase [Bacteroidota bacterium]|nr:UDP-2,3-diacylglucosamine diphosphatase [Bacteroidota bacterium]